MGGKARAPIPRNEMRESDASSRSPTAPTVSRGVAGTIGPESSAPNPGENAAARHFVLFQGSRISYKHPGIMQKRPSFLFVVSSLTIALVLTLIPAGAQDDLDLDIPGLEEESAPADESESSESAGGASEGPVDLLDMIKAGGWAMWVLGAFSLGLIGLLIYCLMDLQKKNFHPDPLVTALEADMDRADLDSAMGKLRSADTCLASTLQASFHHLVEFGYEALGTDKLEETMANAARKFNRGRVRTINYFSVLAQAAPMMGLLGTVSGMIGAFAKLSQGGTGDPSKFAGNISEALITTASGLVIALPAIFCYFIFRDRLQNLVSDCDETAEKLMSRLRRAVTSYHHEG